MRQKEAKTGQTDAKRERGKSEKQKRQKTNRRLNRRRKQIKDR